MKIGFGRKKKMVVSLIFTILLAPNIIALPHSQDSLLSETNSSDLESFDRLQIPSNINLTEGTIERGDGMEQEAEWVHDPKKGEIEEAIHGLDLIHFDFSMTGEVLFVIILLLVVTLLKPTLRWPVFHLFPESILLMIYGVGVAIIIKFFYDTHSQSLTPRMFFIFLLPAIVNDAGLSMQKGEFFQSLPKIMLFAVIGTVLTAIFLATIFFYFTFAYEELTMVSFLHFLVFASLISAVDPVSVLSTFAELDVKKSLFILIFGESLTNDAVTIVLYRTSLNVIKNNDASEQALSIHGVAYDCVVQFCLVCFCGLAIGVIGAVFGVLLMKRLAGYQMVLPVFQLGIPYLVYLFTESLHYSGIIACVVASSFMSYYMANNMCVEMEFVVFTISKTFSSTSEMIIFIYLGLSAVSNEHKLDPVFIGITVVSCFVVRAIVTFSLSYLYNLFATKRDRIPYRDQAIVTYAGIRGAVCFGLVQSIDERVIPAKPYFVTCTLVVIGLTSFVQGCSIKVIMKLLHIPGDNGETMEDSKVMKYIRKVDRKLFQPLLTSETTYLPTDETFRNLGLPKAVSTALRIGERSHTDLYMQGHGEVLQNPAAVSVPRATTSPYSVDFNLDDNLTVPSRISTGRRTPVQRSSIYSRHFVNLRPPSPINDNDANYATCPAGIMKRRPPFDPNSTFVNQNTVSGQVDHRLTKPRHNSVGAEGVELKYIPGKAEKKTSRTIVSGTKKFVVNPEDLIGEESPVTTKKSDDESSISKIDESE